MGTVSWDYCQAMDIVPCDYFYIMATVSWGYCPAMYIVPWGYFYIMATVAWGYWQAMAIVFWGNCHAQALWLPFLGAFMTLWILFQWLLYNLVTHLVFIILHLLVLLLFVCPLKIVKWPGKIN